MEQVKELDTHPTWKHVKSGKLYTLMGYGVWKGGVNDAANDLDNVIAARHGDGLADFDVVPGHYTVTNVKTGDAALMQTTQPLVTGDRVVVYTGDFFDKKDAVYARRYEDFFDGRFVKVDAEGKEVVAVKKASAVGKSETSAPVTPAKEA